MRGDDSKEQWPVGIKECGARHETVRCSKRVSKAKRRVPDPAALLPVTNIGLLLHHGGRDGRRWAGYPHARTRINNRDGIAGAQSRRLVDLHLLAIVRLESSNGVVGVV